MARPSVNILAFLLELLAEQEGVTIKYELQGVHNEPDKKG